MSIHALQHNYQQPAKIIGQITLPGQEEKHRAGPHPDDFLSFQAVVPWKSDALQRELDRIKAEISELRSENRWQDILALLHPVGEKWPELCAGGLDSELIREAAFVLGRLGKYAEAMAVVEPLTVSEPKNVMAWYNYGYAAYEALYAAKKDRSVMPHAKRRQLIDTAHHAFAHCQKLQPDSIAFFYRDAMICKDFEDKPGQAVPLFERAIANYESRSKDEQHNIHQQRPKYIRSMYHLASCMLKIRRPDSSRILLEKLMKEDSRRDHMSPLFKHFALAKTLHVLGEPKKALDHLETAAVSSGKHDSIDYVYELAARCALQLGQIEYAANRISRIPSKRRLPYIRWTESDLLVAKGSFKTALRILEQSGERDRRSRHKSLIRSARIYLSLSQYEKGLDAAVRADGFCLETYGNGNGEAQFWQVACLYRMERYAEAENIILELEKNNFSFPNFRKLAVLIRKRRQAPKQQVKPVSVIKLVK